jgi:hypothetical protein
MSNHEFGNQGWRMGWKAPEDVGVGYSETHLTGYLREHYQKLRIESRKERKHRNVRRKGECKSKARWKW